MFDRSEGVNSGTDVLSLPRGGVGWDRHRGFPLNGRFLSLLVILLVRLTRRLEKADVFPTFLVASSGSMI